MPGKVCYEELFPHELDEIMRERPIAYLPFGTLEWHGLHLALGNDAVKAHELCVRVAEKGGGVVVPATYWAIGGMPHPWTTRVDAELVERLFSAIFEQMAHVGFKAAIAITGHYGFEQYYSLKKAARDFMYKSDLVVAALPEYEVVFDEGYRGDHAAKWETSILWALRPELVDMSRLSEDLEERLEGVGGEDPRVHASRDLGEHIVLQMVERLADLANRLLRSDPLQRQKFISAFDLQVKILGKYQRNLGEVRELYQDFVSHLWKGDYPTAIEKGRNIMNLDRSR